MVASGAVDNGGKGGANHSHGSSNGKGRGGGSRGSRGKSGSGHSAEKGGDGDGKKKRNRNRTRKNKGGDDSSGVSSASSTPVLASANGGDRFASNGGGFGPGLDSSGELSVSRDSSGSSHSEFPKPRSPKRQSSPQSSNIAPSKNAPPVSMSSTVSNPNLGDSSWHCFPHQMECFALVDQSTAFVLPHCWRDRVEQHLLIHTSRPLHTCRHCSPHCVSSSQGAPPNRSSSVAAAVIGNLMNDLSFTPHLTACSVSQSGSSRRWHLGQATAKRRDFRWLNST